METIAITDNEWWKEEIAFWLVFNGISGSIKRIDGYWFISTNHKHAHDLETLSEMPFMELVSPYINRKLISIPNYEIFTR